MKGSSKIHSPFYINACKHVQNLNKLLSHFHELSQPALSLLSAVRFFQWVSSIANTLKLLFQAWCCIFLALLVNYPAWKQLIKSNRYRLVSCAFLIPLSSILAHHHWVKELGSILSTFCLSGWTGIEWHERAALLSWPHQYYLTIVRNLTKTMNFLSRCRALLSDYFNIVYYFITNTMGLVWQVACCSLGAF